MSNADRSFGRSDSCAGWPGRPPVKRHRAADQALRQRKRQLADGAERRTVMPRRPEPAQGLPVRGGAVAGIRIPAIARPARGEPGHCPVAHHLGDDRGRGDGEATPRRRPPRNARGRAAVAGSCRPRSPHPARPAAGPTARRIASMAACRMFSRSISATEAAPTPISTRCARCRAAKAAARAAGESFLESSSSFARRRLTPRGNTTAAATTGPASGPRPTSSTPATRPPRRRSC